VTKIETEKCKFIKLKSGIILLGKYLGRSEIVNGIILQTANRTTHILFDDIEVIEDSDIPFNPNYKNKENKSRWL
jgi:hypothetical protein